MFSSSKQQFLQTPDTFSQRLLMALAEKSETLNSDNQDLLVVYGFLHLNITFSQIPSLDSRAIAAELLV